MKQLRACGTLPGKSRKRRSIKSHKQDQWSTTWQERECGAARVASTKHLLRFESFPKASLTEEAYLVAPSVTSTAVS